MCDRGLLIVNVTQIFKVKVNLGHMSETGRVRTEEVPDCIRCEAGVNIQGTGPSIILTRCGEAERSEYDW
jgi:hypothetical protein